MMGDVIGDYLPTALTPNELRAMRGLPAYPKPTDPFLVESEDYFRRMGWVKVGPGAWPGKRIKPLTDQELVKDEPMLWQYAKGWFLELISWMV